MDSAYEPSQQSPASNLILWSSDMSAHNSKPAFRQTSCMMRRRASRICLDVGLDFNFLFDPAT